MSESILAPANLGTRLKAHVGAILQISLLFWMMAIVIWALADQVRGLHLSWLLPFCALGLTAAWLLARTRRSGRAAGFILLILYLALLVLRIGRLTTLLLNLFSNLLASTWRAFFLNDPSAFASIPPLVEASWMEAYVPFFRIYQWVVNLIRGEAAYDPVVTAILGSALIFSLAAWGAWAVRRRAQPFLAFLPAGASLLIILYITNSQTASLVIFITLALVLFAIVYHQANLTRWDANGIGYAEDINLDVFWTVGALVLVVSTAAFAASSLPLENVLDFNHKVYIKSNRQVENLARSVGIVLNPPGANPFGYLRNPGLPRSHLITAGVQPSKEIVMTIQVEGLSPIPDASGSYPVPHFYWRGLAYDQYTGRGWRTSQTEISTYPAGEPNPAEPAPGARQIHQEVRLIGNLEAAEESILYSAGMPVSLDQERQIAWRTGEDIFGGIVKTRQYSSISLVNEVPASILRLAGETYPQWIVRRYLQVPARVPERVRLLALSLTSAALTPYDRALAIESYLRTFPYTLDVPSAPPGREVSDYFLFDLKRGYCDYYATAMVVLSRSAGLPSRLVTGYASGIFNPDENQYQVSKADAHSWVEVFFPGHGWITFEPTAGLPAMDRLSVAPLPQVDFSVNPAELKFRYPDWLVRLGQPLFWIVAFLLAGLCLLIWWLIDWWRLLIMPPPATAKSLYRRLLRHSRGLPFTSMPSQTPYEVSTALADQVSRLVQNHPFKKIIHPGIEEIAHLVELYVHSIYSPAPPGQSDQRSAVQIWNRLRWRLWLGKWLKRLRRIAV